MGKRVCNRVLTEGLNVGKEKMEKGMAVFFNAWMSSTSFHYCYYSACKIKFQYF